MPMDKPRGVVFIPTPNENHVNKSLRNVDQPSLTPNGSLRAHEIPAYFGVTTMDASHRLCTIPCFARPNVLYVIRGELGSSKSGSGAFTRHTGVSRNLD